MLVNGDLDYQYDANVWEAGIDAVLGREFPVLAVVGNHDSCMWRCMQEKLLDRWKDRGLNVECVGILRSVD